MRSKPKFIFFDVGNTLLFPNRSRIHAPLTDRGFVPEPNTCATWNAAPRIVSTA